jgi:adenine-specific DNA-methyltransferase
MPTLDWLNRADAFTIAARVPYRLLEPVSSHGTGADNLLIQGDNLEALKALLPFYRGQVKCIFIDPPYNTKSAFEHYDDNLEHSQWLSMMLPRLQLLRELLREDGSIWVTIDDNEGHYLKVLMDEVFGRGILWRTSLGTSALHRQIEPPNYISAMTHDHLFWSIRRLRPNSCPTSCLGVTTNASTTQTRTTTLAAHGTLRTLRRVSFTADERPNLFYPLTRWPTTGADLLAKAQPIAIGHMADQAQYEAWLADRDKITLLGSGTGRPICHALRSFSTHLAMWPNSEYLVGAHSDAGHNQEAMLEGLKLFGEIRFGTPKPERLLHRVLQVATNPNDLVLDSFLGSGTTAAVAHKMGRRWIGIEMGEHAATHCLPRLEKVIAGEPGGISAAVNWQGGGGFRFLRLGAPIFGADGCIHPDVRFATLAAFVWQQETGHRPGQRTAARAGTPYLGTHYPIDSSSRPSDAGNVPISLEILPTDLFSAPAPAAEPQPTPPASAPPVGAPRQGTAVLPAVQRHPRRQAPRQRQRADQAVLDALLALHAQIHGPAPSPAVPLVVYGEACRLGPARLKLANLTFRHIPYDVKAR